MQKFLKFAILWGFTYLISIWLTYFFIENLFFNEKISYLFSLSLIVFFNFFSSLRIIFKKNYSNKILFKYFFFFWFFYLTNYFLVLGLSWFFPWNSFYLLIFWVTTFIFFIKYFIYNNFVFIDDSSTRPWNNLIK